ncbi:MAG: hypothetical protein H7346_23175, partial [Burkholderiaceae bacterium]|nr:hypothetical protein [Burkholderiaceae bacterium]
GATTTDHIGSDYYARWNGNSGFVVGSSQFSNNTGALSFSDANGNFAFGTVSSANSLVGSATGDRIGSGYFEQFQFANGKMLITSRLWGAGTGSSGKGALTLLANPSQASGVIDASNSLVGAVAGDGSNLTVTRYDDAGSTYYYGTPTRALVTNPYFNGNRGMATLIDSSLAAAPAGVISASNSLVGSAAGDRVGAFSFVNSRGIVVGSPNWSGNTGAITVGSLSQLAVGNVSAVNSLVGAQAGDQLGSNGVFDAVSYFYTYNASLAGGKGGVTVFTQANATGVISTANTVYGTDTGVGSPTVVNQGSLLRVRFSEGSGRVVYIDPASLGSNGSSASVPQRFADAAGSDVTITPQSITTLTNAGTDVVLQANNDIFVNAAVTTVPTVPNAGSLLLEAGRSIMVNANITTGGGDLGLYANAPNAQAAYRDAGAGSIVTASGVTLSLGGGDMIARVGTGVGGAQGGGISLGQINGADGIFVQNLSTSSGAGISQDASTYWDTRVLALETKADNGSIGTLAQAITFNGQAMAVRAGNAPANIHHTGKQLYFDVPDKSATNTQPDPRQNSNPDPGFRGINLAGVGSLSLVSDGDVFFNTLDSTPFTIGAQNIQIEAAGSVHLSGYLGSASIQARGQLLLNAGRDILVEGGSVANSFAKLVSAGKMQITAGRSFAIHGGSGNGAYALVDPTQPGSTMDVQAPSITLQGGTGGGAYAALVSAGPMTLSYQQLSLTPGSGTDADAVIIAPNAQQLSAQSGKAFIGSGNPLDNGLTDSGFAVPDRQESQVTGQFLADANFISDFLDHYNDGLLNQRRKSLRNEISLEQSCN